MQEANNSVDWTTPDSFHFDRSTYDTTSESPGSVPWFAAVSRKAEEIALGNASSGPSSMPAISTGKAIVPKRRC